MHVRVVRFTDVDSQRLQDMQKRVEFYDSAEDMEAGAKVFEAMDSGDAPGTRASVDACELRLERRAPA